MKSFNRHLNTNTKNLNSQENSDVANWDFDIAYQQWYSEACELIRQLLPSRLEEFQKLYKDDKRKLISQETYTIQDWILGLRSTVTFGERKFKDAEMAFQKLKTQIDILNSVAARFDSTLFDIRQLVQADIFDSELDAARELHKKGFLRGAGAVAGVVLEKHLAQVCDNHAIKFAKKHTSIADFNNALKGNDVLDSPTHIFIDRLRALRNLCDHKGPEPKKEDVLDLIDGTDKITKTLF